MTKSIFAPNFNKYVIYIHAYACVEKTSIIVAHCINTKCLKVALLVIHKKQEIYIYQRSLPGENDPDSHIHGASSETQQTPPNTEGGCESHLRYVTRWSEGKRQRL